MIIPSHHKAPTAAKHRQSVSQPGSTIIFLYRRFAMDPLATLSIMMKTNIRFLHKHFRPFIPIILKVKS
jgi:hypothetical protein